MTENELRINGKSFDETISQLEEFMESDDVHGELFRVLRSARDFMENMNEEIQQYRAIGTVEEVKELKIENAELYCEIQAINATMGLLENEIRAKAIDEMVEGIREILECNAIYNIDCIATLAEQLKAGAENEN